MPKSKVSPSSTPISSGASANRTPVKINSSSTPLWYKILMFTLIAAGLLYMVVYYLASPHIPFMMELGPWNYAIGFALMIVGLLMTMGWR
ncbi:cell division protein CrgA [Corynebacterium canis]|uniref:Cell division protein CrgA n=1 Tax=Corynebacterium canis TaxID=679663 RepID=A0A5C5UD61_9CORY|nr:cell division protein CrgA [Corynebacterium canis]TWT23906.1 cell division protein CrgA [Corynebacterium canis]WJY73888.1 Cell division protein CrgA [Corynebacterium canis]